AVEGTGGERLGVVEGAMEAGQRVWRDRASGQEGLFAEMFAAEPAQSIPLPTVPDWPEKDKLAGEKELLGFWVTGHPLDRYADKVSELATHDSSTLEGLAKNAEVTLCGVLTGVTRKRNKEGKAWAAMTLEDRSGSIEALCFATAYERLASQITDDDQAVMIRGLVLPEENTAPKISVQDVVALDNARIDLPEVVSIRIWIRNGLTERANALEELFKRKPGQTSVRFRLEAPRDFTVLLDVPAKIRPDKEFRRALEEICGPD